MDTRDTLLKIKNFGDIIRTQILTATNELKQSINFLSNKELPNYKEMAIFYLGQASNKLTMAETIYSLDAFVKHAFIKNNIEDIFNELRVLIDNFIKSLIEDCPIDDLLISEFEKKLSTSEFFSPKEQAQ